MSDTHQHHTCQTFSEKWRNRILLLIAFSSSCLAFINMGCITAASPDLSGSFVIGILDVSWSGAACPLGIMASFCVASYLWSRIGLRRSLRFAFLLVMFGAVTGYIADHFLLMVLVRFLQGLGGGLSLVYGSALINMSVSAKFKPLSEGLKISMIGFSSCISPIIGCILVQFWDWRVIFILVGFFSSILCLLTTWFVPNTKIPKNGKFDWFSFSMILFGCLCVIMVLINGETYGWSSAKMLWWLYGGFCGFTLLVISCLTHKTPLLDFSILSNGRFLVGLLASLCNIFCVCWIRAGTVQYLRNILGYEPIGIAIVFISLICAFCIGTAFILPLMLKQKIALRVGMMGGLLGLSVSAYFLSRLNTSSSWIDVAWPLLLFGVGYAFCINIATPLALRGVHPKSHSSAIKVLSSLRFVFISMYSCSVSSVLAYMKTNYHFSVAERAREGAPETISSLTQWQNHFEVMGQNTAQAHSQAMSVLNKAVSLQSQVFSSDYFYLCVMMVGAIGIIFAFLCFRIKKNNESILL